MSKVDRATRSASSIKLTARKVALSGEAKKSQTSLDIHAGSDVEVGPKTTLVAPVVTTISEQALTAPVYENQHTESSSANGQSAAALQEIAIVATHALSSGTQADRFKEHCDFISGGLKDVLDTQRLFDLARPDQLPLAQDLQAVFEIAMRHLEADLAYVFKKHGAGN